MKYVLYTTLILCAGMYLFTACNKHKLPQIYVCLNPFMSLQGIEINTDSPNVKDSGSILELTDNNGNVILMPKSLCVEVKPGNQ